MVHRLPLPLPLGLAYAHHWRGTYRVRFPTENDDPFLNLSFRSVKPVKEGYDVFRLLAVDPVRVGVICYNILMNDMV